MRYNLSIMSKKTVLIAAVVVAAFILFSYLLSQPLLPLEKPFRISPPPLPTGSASPAPTSPSPTPSPTGAPQGATHHIIMDAKGFTPASITIKVGDTVIFDNKDTREHWPASGLHPTHLLCLGFDSQGGIAPGASYAYTFTEAKTCPMHDHLSPKTAGEITVEP